MKFGGAFWSASDFYGESVAFLKPHTYMNLSGKSVAEASRYFDIAPEDIFVVFDDTAIPFGTLRFRIAGSAGGHKGMISIITSLDTLDIPRLRVGVSSPPQVVNMSDWVLGKMPKDQRGIWPDIEAAAWDSLSKWIKGVSGQGFTLRVAETQ
jgi:PTH1 family peptidyl-tRNA hydrolase